MEDRTRRRMKEHDYRKGRGSDRHVWTGAEIRAFLKVNGKMKDWELAKKFKVSIPSVQYIRRKINLVTKLTTNTSKQIELIGLAEKNLRDHIRKKLGKAATRKRTVRSAK